MGVSRRNSIPNKSSGFWSKSNSELSNVSQGLKSIANKNSNFLSISQQQEPYHQNAYSSHIMAHNNMKPEQSEADTESVLSEAMYFSDSPSMLNINSSSIKKSNKNSDNHTNTNNNNNSSSTRSHRSQTISANRNSAKEDYDNPVYNLNSKFKKLFKYQDTNQDTSRSTSVSPPQSCSSNNYNTQSISPKIEEEESDNEADDELSENNPMIYNDHLFIYPNNNTHRHVLKKPKLLDKQPLLPGAGIFSSLLKKDDPKKDDPVSIFKETPELKLLKELKNRKLYNTDSFIPTKRYHCEDEDEDDEDSEPEITDPAIGRPQLELINKLVKLIEDSKYFENLSKNNSQNIRLKSEYGEELGICGRGSYGVVKIVSKTNSITKEEKFFAVKEIRKKAGEDPSHFSKRLISEFIVSLSLNHINIIKIHDLMRNSKGVFSEVLEYCDGGDLYNLIIESKGQGLYYVEADCIFNQLLHGVIFMHSKGIAHCDLKPENLLLTRDGTCKIIDFGASVVFKTAFEDDIHFSQGFCGSEPYVAPEEFEEKYYDPRLTDVWAMGVIYMVMRVGTYLWKIAKIDDDELYAKYINKRPYENEKGYLVKGSFPQIENLLKDGNDKSIAKEKRDILYDILDPDPEDRMTSLDIYDSKWIKTISGCLRNKQ